MRTFLMLDKNQNEPEILGKLHTLGLNFRKIKSIDNGNSCNCFVVETVTKAEQKTILSLAKNTGNLSTLLAVDDKLNVIKGNKIIGAFIKVENYTSNCYYKDGENYFEVI